MPKLAPELAGHDYCYLTTTGRVTGKPHTVELWFALSGATLYVLAGRGRDADFVRNGVKSPHLGVRIDGTHFDGRARIVIEVPEAARARRLLLGKYAPRYRGDLTGWGRDALPFAVDLDVR